MQKLKHNPMKRTNPTSNTYTRRHTTKAKHARRPLRPMQYTLELGGKRLRPLRHSSPTYVPRRRLHRAPGSRNPSGGAVSQLSHSRRCDGQCPYAVVKAPYTKSGAITPPYSRAMVCSLEAYHELALLPPQQLAKVLPYSTA